MTRTPAVSFCLLSQRTSPPWTAETTAPALPQKCYQKRKNLNKYTTRTSIYSDLLKSWFFRYLNHAMALGKIAVYVAAVVKFPQQQWYSLPSSFLISLLKKTHWDLITHDDEQAIKQLMHNTVTAIYTKVNHMAIQFTRWWSHSLSTLPNVYEINKQDSSNKHKRG